MVQRLIGGAVGALVTFALLWLYHADATEWAIAAIVGAIVAFLWPPIVGALLARRARNRREDDIEAEVARRVGAQTDQMPPR
jgi:multisubunit Na+/H+ antiporter MnhG subunit